MFFYVQKLNERNFSHLPKPLWMYTSGENSLWSKCTFLNKSIYFLSHLKIYFLKDVKKYSCRQTCFQIGSRMILLSKVWCRQWNKVDLTIWFCPWLKSSRSIFQTFFCLEYKLRNVFFKNFDKFKKRVPNFWLRAKMENRKGGEKQWERYRREWNF
jgi:hypothetical protein